MITLKEIQGVKKHLQTAFYQKPSARYLFSIATKLPPRYYGGTIRLDDFAPFSYSSIGVYDNHQIKIGMVTSEKVNKEIPWFFNQREEKWSGYSDGERLYVMLFTSAKTTKPKL